jgi:hypothetical protein
MKIEKFNSEIELAEKVVIWLKEQGWIIYQEVTYESIADVVAIKNDVIWIIECKTSFGLKIINQALNWIGCANFISIAIPYLSSYNQKRISNYLPIGIIEVKKESNNNHYINVVKEAPEQEDISELNYFKKRLYEKQKTWAKAGNNQGKRHTAFQDTVEQIYNYLKLNPGSTLKQIITNIHHHYHKDQTAQCAISQWISKGIIKNIIVHREGKKYLYHYKNDPN